MYLFTASRHGVPAKELERQLGVTYKTAWRMAHELRKLMAQLDGTENRSLDSGHVEIDETYVGGRKIKESVAATPSATCRVFSGSQSGADES